MIIKDFIGVYEDCVPKEFCEKIIKTYDDMSSTGFGKVEKQLTNGQLLKDGEALHLVDSNVLKLTSEYSHIFIKEFWSKVYPKYSAKYPILSDADPHTIQHLKVQKTAVGGGFHQWHFESSGRPDLNRLLNVFLFLNTVKEGGESEFLYYGRREKAQQGKLLVYPSSFTHTHRGNPPISNAKYVLNGWVEF